jgi:Domain of unknown function (DUF4062)
MENQPRFFVSAVTSELGHCRAAAKAVLDEKGARTVVQTDLEVHEYRVIGELLGDAIHQSDVVICLIGQAYGVEPASVPWWKARRSYTQLEFHLAFDRGKPMYVFMTKDDAAFLLPGEDEERRRLQREHRVNVGRRTDRLLHDFRSSGELASKIDRIPLEKVRDWLHERRWIDYAGQFSMWMSALFASFAGYGIAVGLAGGLEGDPWSGILQLAGQCLTIYFPGLLAGWPANRHKAWALWLGLAAYVHAFVSCVAELIGFHPYLMRVDEVFTRTIFVLFGLGAAVLAGHYVRALRAYYLPQPDLEKRNAAVD